MSYDVSKLTNLGQLKTALQRVNTVVSSAKASRSIVTIARTDWSSYDNIYRSNSIITPQNYHYYDIHLTSDTSNTISIMCANADIRVKIESNSLYLYCYGTVPTQSFDLEIIDIPISTNIIGLSYDIGDDFLVYPSRIDALETKLDNTSKSLADEYTTSKSYIVGDVVVHNDELYMCKSATSGSWDSSKWDSITLGSIIVSNASEDNSRLDSLESFLGTPSSTPSSTANVAWSRILDSEIDIDQLQADLEHHVLSASNVEVATSKWTTGGISGYTYKAVLNMEDVTANHFPIIQFDDSYSLEFDFSPTVTTGAGTITIYCKTAPNVPIVINSILCIKPSVRTVT